MHILLEEFGAGTLRFLYRILVELLIEGTCHFAGWIFYQVGYAVMKIITLGRFHCRSDEYEFRLSALGFLVLGAVAVGLSFLI